MRKMSYRREMYCEDRYLITNADREGLDADDLPTYENRINPGIRACNTPRKDGAIITDMADYAQLNITLEDDEITPEFRDNYIKILRGELPGWKLFRIELHPGGDPCFNFVNEDSGADEHLFIERAPGLRIAFEVDREDGCTDRYLLVVERKSMILTEYYDHGRCEITFDGIPLCTDGINSEEYSYIYIAEYR